MDRAPNEPRRLDSVRARVARRVASYHPPQARGRAGAGAGAAVLEQRVGVRVVGGRGPWGLCC